MGQEKDEKREESKTESVSKQSRTMSSALNMEEVRLLLVDDDEMDFLFVQRLLRDKRLGLVRLEWVSEFEDALKLLASNQHHICLLDYRLGSRTGIELMELAKERGCVLPFVILTGVGGYDVDLDAMRLGASSYLEKDGLNASQLERVIRYALKSHRVESQLNELAQYDALTGLANARYFREQLHLALLRAERRSESVAVLFLDLDGFKQVNDLLGHPTGNEVLARVGKALRNSLRETDVIGRVGGDEFCVYLEATRDRESVREVCARILSELEKIVIVGVESISIGVSGGIAFFPEDGDDFDTLINRADKAMYHSKDRGGNLFSIFDEAFML